MRSLERGGIGIFAIVALLMGCQQRASQQPAQGASAGSSHAVPAKKPHAAWREPGNSVAERAKPQNPEEVKTLAQADLALSDDDSQDRLQAILTLAEEASDQAAATIATVVVSDTDPVVREEAVYALGERGAESDIETLKHALTDPNDKVRKAVIKVFVHLGAEDAVRFLAVALNDRNTSVRAEAVNALGEIGGDSAVRLLQQAVKDRDPAVREAATEYLHELHP